LRFGGMLAPPTAQQNWPLGQYLIGLWGNMPALRCNPRAKARPKRQKTHSSLIR